MASTPAMVVVLTAPRPTSRMPSLPRAGAIESGEVTIADYIMGKMRMFLRRPVAGQDPLPVSMTGVRAGERVLQVGGDDPALAGLLAAKSGLNGHAAIVVATEAQAGLVRKATAEAGALVDIQTSAIEASAIDDGSFDLVVVHGRKGLLSSLTPEARTRVLRVCHRALRPGGRLVAIEAGTPVGLSALLRARPAADADYQAAGGPAASLQQAGFSAVRLLGDREGYLFTEGIRPAS
jgi:SAM-dependent methyltransferase